MMGRSIESAVNISTNDTEGKIYRFRVSTMQSVYIIAYPTNQTINMSNCFSFSYVLSTYQYPVDGGSWIDSQLMQDGQDYMDYLYSKAKGYYAVIGLMTGIFPVILIIACWIIMRWPFDPPNKFERRRIRMKKELAKMLKVKNNKRIKKRDESEPESDRDKRETEMS